MSNKVLDLDGLEYYHSKNKELLDGKVDKVEGKTLSTNDFTDEYKEKLDSIASNTGGSGVQSDWTATDETSLAFIKNKPTIPTKTSELTNDSGFVTTDTTYEAADEDLGLVKSGGDVTITDGIITVNDDSHNHVIDNVDGLQDVLDTKVPNTRKVNGKALSSDISITASDVGADANGSAASALAEAKGYTDTALETAKSYTDSTATTTLDSAKSYADTVSAEVLDEAKEYNDNAYANANLYTDEKIADLINGAPTTLDTLKEIADAMAENEEVVDALEEAIGTKANQAELDTHTGNSTIHVTSTDKSNWNDANSKKHTHSNKTVLDGITAIDTALSDSSTNPVQNKVIKQAFDGIQSTSKGTLSTVGWYRVAEYESDVSAYLKGIGSNSCELTIKMAAGNTTGEYHVLQLMSTLNSQTIRTVISKLYSTVNRGFTKCRYTYDSGKAYLEVYYNLSVGNLCLFEITHPSDCNYCWKAIYPVATSETVDGVTVTTTYDIPANASPVTDLDLQRFSGADLNTSILEKALEVEIGIHQFRLGGNAYTGGDLPNHINWRYSTATIYKRNNASISVEIHSEAFNKTIVNSYNGVTWTGWGEGATTADLAKYLPLTGGLASGNIGVEKSNATEAKVTAKNTLGQVSLRTATTGAHGLYSDTHGKWIVKTDDSGNTTADLTATGNLALEGTEQSTLSRNVYTPLVINSTQYEGSGTMLGFALQGAKTGYIGMQGEKLVFIDKSGMNGKEILHTGNMNERVLPLNGGGEISKGGYSVITLKNSANSATASYIGYKAGETLLGYLGFGSANTPSYRTAEGKDNALLHTGNMASHVLQLDSTSQQTVTSPVRTPIVIKSTHSGTDTLLGFRKNDNWLGFLGFDNLDNPVFLDSGGNSAKKLLHEGNMASYVLPLTGGKLTGNLNMTADNTSVRDFEFGNSAHSLLFRAQADGLIYIWDRTLSKNIARFNADGTTEWFGTSTGNLPLDGGGEVKKAGATPLKLTNTSGVSCYTPHYGKDGFLGALGFNGADKPIMLKSDANTMVDLLHTGNYSNYALPKTGGTISANSVVNLVLNSTDTTNPASYIEFRKNGTSYGYFGYNGANKPVVYSSTLGVKNILHEGNYSDYALSLTGGTQLKSGDDVNDCKTPGVYIVGNATTAAAIVNTPITGSGYKIIVLDGYISGRVTQFVTTGSNSMYYRQFNGTTWQEWASVYSSTNKPKLTDLGINASTTELNYVDGVTSSIQTQLNAKAPLASPTLTGTPKAPTATAGTNTTQIATTAFVQTAISNLVDGAPETLNTLKEVSDALAEHEEVTDALNASIGNKVDKVSGKGLSTNDYTTTEKNKLAGIATGAEVNQNAFSNVKVGDTTVAADSKTDTLELVAGSNVTITPDATNDKITIAATNTDTKVKITAVAPTTKTKYYPTMHTSTSGTTTVSASTDVAFSVLNGTTSDEGLARLILGNGTATGTANNSTGKILMYSGSSGYHTLGVADTTSTPIHTLPATGGTVLNTGTTSVTQKLTSGTEIGTVKINGTSTKLYAPTNTDSSVKQTQSTTANYRALLMGTSYNSDASQLGAEETGQVYKHTSIVACPSTGEIKATKFTGALNGNAATATSLNYFKNTSTAAVALDDTTANCIAYTNNTSSILGQTDGALYKQVYSDKWVHEIYGDYRTGQLAVRGLNSGTWSAWRTVLDSTNFTSYVTPAKIGAATSGHTHSGYASTSVATTSANGLMSSTDKTKLEATNIAYGTCSTAAGTAAKVVTISGNTNWKLAVGSVITVKFSNTNSASSVTLNVNSTGAKSIWYNNAAYTSTSSAVCGAANRYITYMYDGTYWVWISSGADSNTTYSNASLGQGYGTCATAEATTAKVVTLSSYSLTTGGVVAVKFTYAVPASATMNINSKGAKNIFYRGAAITAGVIKAGDIGVFIYDGTQYHLLTVDRDVDTNTTYSAGTGISISSSNAISNSGVRSISTGSTNGTISVNTNGTSAEVAVKGLGSAAYTASTAYATASHTHSGYAASSHNHTSLSGALTITGTESSTAQLAFKREGYNYITFPSTGNLAFATSATGAGITVSVSASDMSPYTDNTKTLGTSSKRWSNVYATTFTGSGSGLTSLNASNISSGTLAIANGGTGATDAATARTNLGLGSAATKSSTTSISSGGTGLITSGAVYTALAGKANTSHVHAQLNSPNDAYYLSMQDDGNLVVYKKSDTSVIFDTNTQKVHTQSASTITAGTFGGAVVAPASTAYTTNQIRNTVFTTTDPGAGATTSYANGSIICVYE